MALLPADDPESEQLATPDEAMSAWRALSQEDKVRLGAFAEMEARFRQRYAPGLTGKDLLNEAAVRVLEGKRNWPLRKIAFIGFMFGTVKSIAGDLKRTNEGKLRAAALTEADLRTGDDANEGINPIENLSAGLDTPETFALAEDQLAAIQSEFEDDETAWYVLECAMEGYRPREIRERLNLSDHEFDAARKRIARRIAKFFLSH